MQMRESIQICCGRTSAIGTSNRSGGIGRNELSANAMAASVQRPYRCSENVPTYCTKRLRVTGADISAIATSSVKTALPCFLQSLGMIGGTVMCFLPVI